MLARYYAWQAKGLYELSSLFNIDAWIAPVFHFDRQSSLFAISLACISSVWCFNPPHTNLIKTHSVLICYYSYQVLDRTCQQLDTQNGPIYLNTPERAIQVNQLCFFELLNCNSASKWLFFIQVPNEFAGLTTFPVHYPLPYVGASHDTLLLLHQSRLLTN